MAPAACGGYRRHSLPCRVKKLVQQNTKDSCEAVRDVINYTKRLVSSVKQNMRVLWLEAKKHFTKTPQAYHDIIPYPSDAKYDPTAHPFEVDHDLFVEDESGNSGAVWGYLDKARDGFYDAKLIACYGHAGVGWPVLKCDGTDSRDSYPMVLRTRLITITAQIDAAKAKKKAEEEAEKVQAEQDRLAAIRVKVTITAALSGRDYETMPIHISPSWRNFPHVEDSKPLHGGKKKGEGKIEFDDVPLGEHKFYAFSKEDVEDERWSRTEGVVVLTEADVESGQVVDISESFLVKQGGDEDGDDNEPGEGDVDAGAPSGGDGASDSQ